MRNYGRSPFDGSKNSYLSGNHREDEIQAAMLTEELCDLDVIGDKRRQLIALYIELLSQSKIIFHLSYQRSSAFSHCGLSDPRRQDFIDFMHKSGVDWYSLQETHSQPCIDKALLQIDPFRNQATIISSKIVSLPLSECHTSNEIIYVASVICSIFSGDR